MSISHQFKLNRILLAVLVLSSSVANAVLVENINKPVTEQKVDTLTLVYGIEGSDNPILQARPAAYAVGYGRRLGK